MIIATVRSFILAATWSEINTAVNRKSSFFWCPPCHGLTTVASSLEPDLTMASSQCLMSFPPSISYTRDTRIQSRNVEMLRLTDKFTGWTKLNGAAYISLAICEIFNIKDMTSRHQFMTRQDRTGQKLTNDIMEMTDMTDYDETWQTCDYLVNCAFEMSVYYYLFTMVPTS